MQVKHHSTIVKRYSECEGAYAHLADDGYVYQKLIGHIAASGIYFTAKKLLLLILTIFLFFLGDFDLLGDLLSQLLWVMAAAKSGNAMSLLVDYRLHKSKIPQQV